MQFDLKDIELYMTSDEFSDYRKKWIRKFNESHFPTSGFQTNYYRRDEDPIFLTDDSNWIPYSGKLEVLSDWIKEDHCWMKIVIGGNSENVNDRRIFIEKTPRVFDPSLGLVPEDWRGWISGYKGHADEGEGPDLESIKWAEEFAKFLGYRLNEND